MRLDEIEQMFASMSGDRLLNELTVFAAMHLDAHHNDQEDDIDRILRAIHARLAETGIARKYHERSCRFMLGDDHCPCSDAHWSWPRKGLTSPPIEGQP